jgi:hypothetical protein
VDPSASSSTHSGASLERRPILAWNGPNGSAVAPDFQDHIGTNADVAIDLPRVFHRLNNQLGIILANAELLESRLTEETERARASQVVSGALEAISTIQDLRRMVGLRALIDR